LLPRFARSDYVGARVEGVGMRVRREGRDERIMNGMDSARLSRREKQPGHDRTFEESERNFIEVARKCLDRDEYSVEASPKDLRDLFAGPEPPDLSPRRARPLGIELEAVIVSKRTGRRLYVEVKKQGDRGNAEERACKHHTVQFYNTMKERFGYDYHPVVTVFCEALATNPRYTRKFPYYFEKDQYFLWLDYDPELLCTFLTERCSEWLDE
ncbi:MAG: MunI family type II restriction endonuclease, partial [bacterium]|nr:MunI family type II restriction endonuclease [bacterium]